MSKPPRIGQLNRLIYLQTRAQSPAGGSAGTELSETYTTVGTAYARIEGVAGAVYTAGVNTEERATHRITIRYRADFTAWAYLLEGTARRWRVRSVVDLDGTRRYLTILAEELTPEE